MSQGVRSVAARIGLTALNLLLPGLGLLRLGRGRLALLLLAAPPAAHIVLIGCYALLPKLGFAGYAASVVLLFALVLGLMLWSILLTWRHSRQRDAGAPRWSRWYALVAVYAVTIALLLSLVEVAHTFYKPFYLPSEGMAPTLLKNDRLLAAMGPATDPKRGDVILFPAHRGVYVKRVVALPGDTIGLRDGIVILNGRPVPQRFVGEEAAEGPYGPGKLRRLLERFPGERRPHAIYDAGPAAFDDMREQRIAEGHVFVLGDNRDMSADSRVSKDQMGVEQVPIASIVGRPLFITWGASGRRGVDLR